MSYSDLIPFATVRQLEYIEAIEGSQGSTYKAAKKLLHLGFVSDESININAVEPEMLS